MKNVWTEPTLTTYGAVEDLTKRVKTFGKNDGFVLNVPAAVPGIPGTPGPVNIGS